MRLTGRHARAVAAGAATTGLYLAGARLSDSRTVRGAGLLTLMLAAIVSAQDTAATAKKTAKRVDALVGDVHDAKASVAGKLDKTGGTITGSLIVQGSLDAQSGLDMNNTTISRCNYINPADGNSNVHSNGGMSLGSNIDMGGSNVNNCGAVSNGSNQVGHPSGLSAATIGPGGSRANLGTYTVTTFPQAQSAINAVAARADWLNGQGNAANWNY